MLCQRRDMLDEMLFKALVVSRLILCQRRSQLVAESIQNGAKCNVKYLAPVKLV